CRAGTARKTSNMINPAIARTIKTSMMVKPWSEFLFFSIANAPFALILVLILCIIYDFPEKRKRYQGTAVFAASRLDAEGLAGQAVDRQKYGCDDDERDHAEYDHHDRLDDGLDVLDLVVDLFFIVCCDLVEHLLHRTGLLADAEHVRDEFQEVRVIVEGIGQR